MHSIFSSGFSSSPSASAAIRLRCKWLSAAVLVLMVCMPAGVVWNWATAPASGIASGVGVHIVDLQAWQRVIAAAVAMVPIAFIVLGLQRVRSCLAHFADGRFFTEAAIDGLRGFAAAMLYAGIAGMATPSLLSLVLTAANGPGQHQLVVSLNTGQLLMILIAALVWIVTSVMVHAAAIEAENQQFI
ncbi:MAG: hypothetical protein ACLGI6_10505 [Gammaproteobacteria bacterium]